MSEGKRIPMGWCEECGRPEQVLTEEMKDGRTRVTVFCACSPKQARKTVIEAGERYTLVLGAAVEMQEKGGTMDAGDASRDHDASAEGREDAASTEDRGGMG